MSDEAREELEGFFIVETTEKLRVKITKYMIRQAFDFNSDVPIGLQDLTDYIQLRSEEELLEYAMNEGTDQEITWRVIES